MTNLQATIDKLLREQTDESNLLEALWRLHAAHVEIPAGGVQWIESRRCFFVGALMLFEAMMRILDPGVDPTDADLARMNRIARELQRFGDELKAGTA